MNDDLKALYTSWKEGLDRDNPIATKLSPPSLVSVAPPFENASDRVLIVGQEDMGNQWSQAGLNDYPAYGYAGIRWPYENISTWADFLSVENSVEALMHGYELSAFCKHQPKNFSSPYWRAFRRFTNDGARGAATNLDRTSYQGGAIDDGPAQVRAFLNSQETDLLQKEISILEPKVCIYFTGPNRDHLINQRWEGIEQVGLSSNIPARQLCRLVHETLPKHSYRTYHPGYLQRSGKGFYLDEIERHLSR